jgi:hypothetical protein
MPWTRRSVCIGRIGEIDVADRYSAGSIFAGLVNPLVYRIPADHVVRQALGGRIVPPDPWWLLSFVNQRSILVDGVNYRWHGIRLPFLIVTAFPYFPPTRDKSFAFSSNAAMMASSSGMPAALKRRCVSITRRKSFG